MKMQSIFKITLAIPALIAALAAAGCTNDSPAPGISTPPADQLIASLGGGGNAEQIDDKTVKLISDITFGVNTGSKNAIEADSLAIPSGVTLQTSGKKITIQKSSFSISGGTLDISNEGGVTVEKGTTTISSTITLSNDKGITTQAEGIVKCTGPVTADTGGMAANAEATSLTVKTSFLLSSGSLKIGTVSVASGAAFGLSNDAVLQGIKATGAEEVALSSWDKNNISKWTIDESKKALAYVSSSSVKGGTSDFLVTATAAATISGSTEVIFAEDVE